MISISPTQSNIQTALKSFLLAVLPAGTDIIIAQANRVPEPSGPNFVTMTPLRFERIETNIDSYADVKFTAAIAGGVMTVSDVALGTIITGATVFGPGVASNTLVVKQLSGATGGAGTYSVSGTQSVASVLMSAGAKTVQQNAKLTMQLDFHSAGDAAGDMAMIVSTLLRDPFGVEQFASQDPNYGVVPLYADDPVQRPFINEQQQYETRWVLEAMLQANQVVSIPQQFADSTTIETISVDASYPP